MVTDFLPPRSEPGRSAHGPRGRAYNLHTARQFNRQPAASAAIHPSGHPTTHPGVPQPPPSPGGPGLGPIGFKPPKKSFKERLRSLSKKQWIIIGIVAVLILGGGTAAALTIFGGDPPKQQATTKKKPVTKAPPQPTTVPSKLTGLPVDPSFNERQVTAVMIENSQDARPQSGLANAGVLFEAVAEGGITRFLTLFQDDEPEYVGPVRSVRPYYIQWARGFDAAIAHVGGSAEGLAMMRSGVAKDLDQFANSAAFWRVSNRFAPHNMYTSIPKLNEVETKRGYTKSDYTALLRKTKEAPAATPTARTIDFNISGAIYNSHYDYDPTTNSYKRSEGGKPHTDEKTGTQLAPKVVIGLIIPQGRNGVYTTYQTIGNGEAIIFQDGLATLVNWSKTSNAGQFVFTDAAGAPVKLNPGQTWFSVVGSRDRITYAP